MDREIVFRFCRENYGTEPDYPFKDDRVSAVLRHSDTRKWYALVMEVSLGVFSLPGEKKIEIVNLKTDPVMSGSFINGRDIFPAYHMSKSSWISVLLDSAVSEETLKLLIDVSYELTGKKYVKNKKSLNK